ncbi:MAG: hypothetical protein WCK09_10510 [Bacteroidota bacterium]
MNTEFSMNRFWRLIILHLGENRKLFLVIMGVVSLFLIYLDIVQDNVVLIFLLSPIVLCLSGCLITANFYGKWSDFSQASYNLLLPATQLEKFLAVVFFSVVLFIPCFILFYFPIGLLFLHLFHPSIPIADMIFFRFLDDSFNRITLNTFLAYFVLQPLFMTIAARFKKHQFLIGALAVVFIFSFVIMMNTLILPNLSHRLAFNYTNFMTGGPVGYYPVSLQKGKQVMEQFNLQAWVYTANRIVYLFIAAGLYLAAWYSLKERKI